MVRVALLPLKSMLLFKLMPAPSVNEPPVVKLMRLTVTSVPLNTTPVPAISIDEPEARSRAISPLTELAPWNWRKVGTNAAPVMLP